MTAPVSEAPEVVATIEGRPYVAVGRETTFEHRLYMAAALRAAGLGDLLTGKASVTDERGVEAVLWRAIESREVWRLLAGSLVARGETWTEAKADRLVPVLRGLTDDTECRELLGLTVRLIARFFVRGASSGQTSASASPSGSELAPPIPGPPAPPIEALATSASGA